MARRDTGTGGGTAIGWGELADAAIAGDRVSYTKLARLVTGYLARWRAYDFRGDWEDVVQEVLVSTIAAYGEGRFESDAAFQAYVRQATRFKFIDRIRANERVASGTTAEEAADRGESAAGVPWPPETSLQAAAVDLRLAVREAIARLGERERLAVLEVHLRGRTYEEAAANTGIPLGSLKRALRAGLAQLREVLDDTRSS